MIQRKLFAFSLNVIRNNNIYYTPSKLRVVLILTLKSSKSLLTLWAKVKSLKNTEINISTPDLCRITQINFFFFWALPHLLGYTGVFPSQEEGEGLIPVINPREKNVLQNWDSDSRSKLSATSSPIKSYYHSPLINGYRYHYNYFLRYSSHYPPFTIPLRMLGHGIEGNYSEQSSHAEGLHTGP